ncbi:hypothetical protein [Maridesulfovibrio sp. FT414]|uniref:hypothetical protein n=1 Tax=Maridesulfovibrio sp. FT414 TaxID=2979469 RepID=UPI003D801009
MKLTTAKTMFIIILTAIMIVFATAVSQGASFRLVMENQGKTWKLGNSNYLGSVGLKDLQATSTFTLADITAHIDQGTAVRFYAGKGLSGFNEFTLLTPDTVFDYTGLTGEQTIENAFYVEFETNKIRFAHFDYEGHKHLHGNMDLGILEQVPAPIPVPSAWTLAIVGLVCVAAAGWTRNHSIR